MLANDGLVKVVADAKNDLLVVAVNAAQVPDLVEEIISRDAAHAVMLIPGGMGETERNNFV